MELNYIKEFLINTLSVGLLAIFCMQLGGKYVFKSTICSYID